MGRGNYIVLHRFLDPWLLSGRDRLPFISILRCCQGSRRLRQGLGFWLGDYQPG